MTYEVHLTVQLNQRGAEDLATFASAHGCRFLHIVLEAGTHPSQPMLSWRQAQGLDEAMRRAAALSDDLERQGMKLARLKVEAGLAAISEAEYFEAHFKVELDDGQASELQDLARRLGVHLSRNARQRALGSQQRFLTARHPARSGAECLFDSVEAALRRGPWRLVSAEREAVLHDSNLALDDAWST